MCGATRAYAAAKTSGPSGSVTAAGSTGVKRQGFRAPLRLFTQEFLGLHLAKEPIEVEDVDPGAEAPWLGLDDEPGERWVRHGRHHDVSTGAGQDAAAEDRRHGGRRLPIPVMPL